VVLLPGRVVRERLANLRQHTASYHDALERELDIDARLGSVDRYIDLLACLYGFYEPFEAVLEAAVARWRLPFNVEARRKSPRIARDLSALGVTPLDIDALQRCTWTPRPDGPAATLGCLYVAEGATLGGQRIVRQVERSLGITLGTGAEFFASYGADVGPRWLTFCSVLADASRVPVAQQSILTAASDTFVAFDRWLRVARSR